MKWLKLVLELVIVGGLGVAGFYTYRYITEPVAQEVYTPESEPVVDDIQENADLAVDYDMNVVLVDITDILYTVSQPKDEEIETEENIPNEEWSADPIDEIPSADFEVEYDWWNEEPVAEQGPVPFIIDQDFSTDVDDVLAISVAMYFQDAGLIDVRGIALESTSPRAAWAMNALLSRHGYNDIPVAVNINNGFVMENKYHVGMEQNYTRSSSYLDDPVFLYRKILSQADQPVSIVTTGQVLNIQELLQSEPDQFSEKDGMELVRDKVSHIYMVACKESGRPENNNFYCGVNYNDNKHFGTQDAALAAKFVAEMSPVPLMYVYSEVGGWFNVGQFYRKSDPDTQDIITRALADQGTPDGRQAFDPMGVMVAVADAVGKMPDYNLVKERGTMHIYKDGSSQWMSSSLEKNHWIVHKVVEDSWYASIINQMLAFEFTKRTGKQAIF